MGESFIVVFTGPATLVVGLDAALMVFCFDWLRRSSMSWRNDLDLFGSHPTLYSHPPLLGETTAVLVCRGRFIVGRLVWVTRTGFVVVAAIAVSGSSVSKKEQCYDGHSF
jgi:hypothetical protein